MQEFKKALMQRCAILYATPTEIDKMNHIYIMKLAQFIFNLF